MRAAQEYAEKRLAQMVRIQSVEVPRGEPWRPQVVLPSNGYKAGGKVNLIVEGTVRTISDDGKYVEIHPEVIREMSSGGRVGPQPVKADARAVRKPDSQPAEGQ